jgi:RbcX protein
MDRKQVAKATTKVISSYLTYQAVQTVVAQLTETNPPLAIWLRGFSGRKIVQDGEVYLLALLAENQELAFRVMTVREHLVEEIMDDLPEMVFHDIKHKNTQHRRQQLEKLSQLSVIEPNSQLESSSE